MQAKQYVEKRLNGDYRDLPKDKRHLHYNDVQVYDAMVMGWILFPPFDFVVKKSKNNEYSVTTPEDVDPSGIVDVIEVEDETMLSVNTLWRAEMPEEQAALLVHPSTDTEKEKENIRPSKILRRDAATEGITVLLNISSEFAMTENDALIQFIPIEDGILSASYREATGDERKQIDKEERRNSLYPDAYGASREETRWGDIQSAHSED